MVDLRHEAAHRVLPSLSILREGANHALAWLRKEYWETQNRKGHLEKEPEGCSDDIDTRGKFVSHSGLVLSALIFLLALLTLIYLAWWWGRCVKNQFPKEGREGGGNSRGCIMINDFYNLAFVLTAEDMFWLSG